MKKIIFLGLISFLLAALWLLPLSFAKPYAEKYVNGLQLENVSGTVWNGKVGNFTIANTNLEKVDWKVKPLESLTSLSLKVAFTINSTDLTANGLAGLTPSQTLILDDTQFDLNAKYINTLQKNAKVSGDIKGNISHVEIDQQNLPLVNAVIDWKEAAVNSPIKLAQGDYKAIITPESGNLAIKLTSSDAPMELDGKITLNKEWLYDADVNLKSSDPGLDGMLGLLGKKQADGKVNVKKKGDLKPFLGKASVKKAGS